jgi:hypothetical protein
MQINQASKVLLDVRLQYCQKYKIWQGMKKLSKGEKWQKKKWREVKCGRSAWLLDFKTKDGTLPERKEWLSHRV